MSATLSSANRFIWGRASWLDDSAQGDVISAVAVSRPASAFQQDGVPVMMLITVAMADNQPLLVLETTLPCYCASSASPGWPTLTLLALLTSEVPEQANQLTVEFVVRNEHGLRARPGTALVSVIKQFDSTVTITNLDGSGKPVNERSLMKVVALGVKKGHKLHFTAEGNDAEQTLQAISETIASGLVEREA